MGSVVRSTKSAGGTNFTSGTTILSAEINTDFNTIYTDYNGNIDENNLATDAVTSDKIAASAVIAAKIATDAVTADKIATDAVTNTKIIANAVTTAKIATATVTGQKLAGGASVRSLNSVAVPTFGPITTTETQLFTLPSFTPFSTASRIIFFGSIAYFLQTTSTSSTSVIIRIKRGVGGTTIFRIDYELQAPSTGTRKSIIPSPIAIEVAPVVAATVYEVTGQVNAVGSLNTSSGTDRGTYYALELA